MIKFLRMGNGEELKENNIFLKILLSFLRSLMMNFSNNSLFTNINMFYNQKNTTQKIYHFYLMSDFVCNVQRSRNKRVIK